MAAEASADHAQLLYQLADIDKQTAGAIAFVLQPVLSVSTLLMISRIVLSWYPQVCFALLVSQPVTLCNQSMLLPADDLLHLFCNVMSLLCRVSPAVVMCRLCRVVLPPVAGQLAAFA